MSLGSTIKKLRRNLDMTQEDLAEMLSISSQAVSRWETDSAMPDISLIAPLCSIFDISADELLGIDTAKKEEKVHTICNEASSFSSRGYLDEARKILDDGLNKFPNHPKIIYELMYLSYMQYNACAERQYLDDAIVYGEKLLASSTNNTHRNGAVQILCYAYKDAGRLEDATKMAESMPYMVISRDFLLTRVLSGNKAYSAKQSLISNLVQHLSNNLNDLQTVMDSGEYAYTPAECAILRDKRIALLHLFYENGDFGFYHSHLSDTHLKQAKHYAQIGDLEKALEHLSFAATHSIRFITESDMGNTALVFRGSSRGSWSTNIPENDAAVLLGNMEDKVFDSIRSCEEFIKIKNMLTSYAGSWIIE